MTNAGASARELPAALAQVKTPWLRQFVVYDAVPVLERTLVPVLALNGSLDLQVLASLNVPALEGAFQRAGNDDLRLDPARRARSSSSVSEPCASSSAGYSTNSPMGSTDSATPSETRRAIWKAPSSLKCKTSRLMLASTWARPMLV